MHGSLSERGFCARVNARRIGLLTAGFIEQWNLDLIEQNLQIARRV